MAGGGCASRESQPVLRGEYKKLLERQKAGIPTENDVAKKLPVMTVPEHTCVGDTYL